MRTISSVGDHLLGAFGSALRAPRVEVSQIGPPREHERVLTFLRYIRLGAICIGVALGVSCGRLLNDVREASSD
jgi:hypothetical protein